jgi:hypothetical protein
LAALFEPLEPVASGDHVTGIAIFEVGVNICDDDRIQIDEKGDAFQAEQVLAPESNFGPFAGHVRRNFTTKRRQGQAYDLWADAGGIVGEADDLKIPSDVSGDHSIEHIDVLGPVGLAPFDAEDVFQIFLKG